MAAKKIRALLEELAQSLVLADPSDLASLAEIHTHLQSVEQETEGVIKRAAQAAAALVERLILSEVDPRILETVGQTVSLFQAGLLSGRKLTAEEFPRELGLSDKPTVRLPANVDEAIFGAFLAGQAAVLEEMEELVLSLEKSANDERLAEFRRLIHTLKGEAGLMGLTEIERLCHQIEDAVESRPFQELADPLLAAKDWLYRTVQYLTGKGDEPEPFDPALLAPPKVEAATPAAKEKKPRAKKGATTPKAPRKKAKNSEDPAVNDPAPLPAAIATSAETLTGPSDNSLLKDFLTEASEHLETADVHLLTLETTPKDLEALNAVFRSFHTIKGVAGFLELADISALAHEAENLLDLARTNAIVLSGPAIDVTFDAVDALKRCLSRWSSYLTDNAVLTVDPALDQLIHRIKLAAKSEDPDKGKPASPKLGEILVVTGKATAEAVEATLQSQRKESKEAPAKLGELLVKNAAVPAKDVAHALRAQQASETQQHGAIAVNEVVKVDAQRLDRIVDNIGELVIAVSMVRQSVLLGADTTDLGRQLTHLDKITRELQEMGTSLRMVPVRPVFQKMARLARDLAKKIGKQVEFVTQGDDTELDKAVVDRIGDPLVHMVRNAIDHGLESDPEDRIKLGKSPIGKVELRAFHKAGNIHIEITDDGKGLDREAIRKKAIERGLISESDILTDRETFALVFQPGFSTAKQVTDVSGRGVGMDVVKRNIEALRGRVEVQSEVGRGSSFSISLPLTLAIIDGMVIRVGAERYIVPTLSIVTSLRPEPGAIRTVLGKGEMLTFQNELVPLLRVHRIFDLSSDQPGSRDCIVVIVENEGHKTGLVVDELIGQQQIVIKSLGESLRGMPGITGGAIMPDGRVGLILDVGGLVKVAHAERVNVDAALESSLEYEPEPAGAFA